MLLLTGCVSAKYKSVTTTPQGVRTEVEASFQSPAFGSKVIQEADFMKGQVKGVKTEQSTMAEVFTAGAAAGIKLATPVVP